MHTTAMIKYAAVNTPLVCTSPASQDRGSCALPSRQLALGPGDEGGPFLCGSKIGWTCLDGEGEVGWPAGHVQVSD